MPSLTLAIALALFIGILVKILLDYIQIVWHVRKWPNAGPVLPLVGNAMIFFGVPPEDILPVIKGVAQRYPEQRKVLACLGTELRLLVYHPEIVEPFLNSMDHTTKSRDYDYVLPWLNRGLLTSYGEKWKQRRKMLTPAFHFKILEDSIRIFNKHSNILNEILITDGKSGDVTLDLFPYITRCTLDIILESAMGVELEVQNNRESDYAKAINSMLHLLQYRQKSPWLWPDLLFGLSKWKKIQDRDLSVLHGFTRSVIQERRKSMKNGTASAKGKMAFLDLLMNVRTTDGQELSDEDLKEEVDTFMFEGHDTTACALSWALLLLANHPDVQDKILEEQREIYGDDMDANVEQEHLPRMKYLECCIKEALRLYPSVPLFARKTNKEILIDGLVLPKDSTAIILPIIQHRNPEVWSDPDSFKPERFLPGNIEETSRHPYAYIPFSAGPRNCIGQKFALMEEKSVLSKVLRKVRVEKVDTVEDVKPVIEIITRPHQGIKARFVPRIKSTC